MTARWCSFRIAARTRLGRSRLLRILSYLPLAFIQIERGVQLRLTGKEFFELALVFEGAAHLVLVIGEGFLLPLNLISFLLRQPVERPERVLDALHRPDGVLSVEMSAVRVFAANKQIGEFRLAIEGLHVGAPA